MEDPVDEAEADDLLLVNLLQFGGGLDSHDKGDVGGFVPLTLLENGS